MCLLPDRIPGHKTNRTSERFTYDVHRRRLKTEEIIKVVVSVWGLGIYSSPCRSSYFAYR